MHPVFTQAISKNLPKSSNITLRIVIMGIVATLMMDLGNLIFASFELVYKINYSLIGVLSFGWLKGVFIYNSINDIVVTNYSYLFGVATHYFIGIIFAIPVFFMMLLLNLRSYLLLIIYGILTCFASLFLLFPSLGLGLAALKTSSPFYMIFSSLLNHFFYGLGLAIANYKIIFSE